MGKAMNRIYQGRVSKVETSFSASDGEKVAKPYEVNNETHQRTRIKLAAKERMERKNFNR
jgi:hypothetical protein